MMHEEPEIDEGKVRLVRASQTEYAWQDEKGDLTLCGAMSDLRM